jgi:hypothetical protein
MQLSKGEQFELSLSRKINSYHTWQAILPKIAKELLNTKFPEDEINLGRPRQPCRSPGIS